MGGKAMTDVNSRRTIIAIVFLAVVGPCVFILQPGFVQGLVAYLSFSEQQAGLIASAEMFGLAATTVLLSFISSRVAWQKFMTWCIVVSAIGNLASIGQTSFETLAAIRFATGLGSGGIISLTFTMMGLTERSDRNFGYIIVWVLTYGALGLLVMPSVFATIGMNGMLVFFAALTTSQFLGIAGAFLAVVLEVRLGRLLPLAIGIIGGAASIYLLVGDGDGDISANRYWIGVCGFNFHHPPSILMTNSSVDQRSRRFVDETFESASGYLFVFTC